MQKCVDVRMQSQIYQLVHKQSSLKAANFRQIKQAEVFFFKSRKSCDGWIKKKAAISENSFAAELKCRGGGVHLFSPYILSGYSVKAG